MRHTLLASFHRLEDWEDERDRLRAEHHAIYDAIAAGDVKRAGDLVESHIRRFHHDVVRTVLQSAEGTSDQSAVWDSPPRER